MLYSLATEGQAPKFFAKLTSHGVPLRALCATTVIGMSGFITSIVGDGVAYTFLLTLSALAGFITWIGISWSHYKFRMALKAQNVSLDTLPYKSPFFPLGAIVALVLCFGVVIGQAIGPVAAGEDFLAILTPYLGIPVFLGLWGIHKLVTKLPAVIPAEADLERNKNW